MVHDELRFGSGWVGPDVVAVGSAAHDVVARSLAELVTWTSMSAVRQLSLGAVRVAAPALLPIPQADVLEALAAYLAAGCDRLCDSPHFIRSGLHGSEGRHNPTLWEAQYQRL